MIGLTLTKISIPKPPTLGRQQIRKIVIPFDPQRLVAAANTFFLTRSAPLLKQEKSTAACTELYTDIIHTLRYILSTSRVPIRIIQAPPILVNQALSPKVNESFAHDVLAGASETDHLSTIFLVHYEKKHLNVPSLLSEAQATSLPMIEIRLNARFRNGRGSPTRSRITSICFLNLPQKSLSGDQMCHRKSSSKAS